jgi:hypothetical protein
MTFKDIRVNGIGVDVEEFQHPFSFKKGQAVQIPVPLRAKVNLQSAAKTALREFSEPKSEWLVSGTVFVFGKFKKLGFSFKRVVPIEFKLIIKNPLTT